MPKLQALYSEMLAWAHLEWETLTARFDVPYLPNVTLGWDPSPRTVQSDRFDPRLGDPHTSIISAATPENFGLALDNARAFVEKTKVPLATINAWNEWTEGSHLEPDTLHGAGHLKQIRRVFGSASPPELSGASGPSPAGVSS
ncbi:glycoside hydrolase family 99-like domain-containing protein [Arthrobacter sp. StoSoilB5]|uniref:glycoside hydrolase family 99-like domain-containing protein n=1 Tax=Arthrobacter sp. StoSoilB5 TaxID=2830992 RepID=UPI001CC6A8AC|nr:glycoside hydrolase family 99-like domain-containing protein [Arthrobacter sp. StoSoilB5]